MKTIFPPKLKVRDEIRVISPSRSLSIINKKIIKIALRRFENELGLKVTFSKKRNDIDIFDSSSIENRAIDLNEAFEDKKVKGIIASIGGYNSNQILNYINWENIKNNPKIFCGFSDITILNNAIYAKTGLVTYSGPNFSLFGQKKYFDYTLEYFKRCLMSNKPYELTPSKYWFDDNWKKNQNNRIPINNNGFLVINPGKASGKIIGGNLCSLNLLQGTCFMPQLNNVVIFLEDDNLVGMYSAQEFDRNLQSLIQQPNFNKVNALIIGRFQKESKVNVKKLTYIIKSKKELNRVLVIANVDFGHTDPKITFPIGGTVFIETIKNKATIKVINF